MKLIKLCCSIKSIEFYNNELPPDLTSVAPCNCCKALNTALQKCLKSSACLYGWPRAHVPAIYLLL